MNGEVFDSLVNHMRSSQVSKMELSTFDLDPIVKLAVALGRIKTRQGSRFYIVRVVPSNTKNYLDDVLCYHDSQVDLERVAFDTPPTFIGIYWHPTTPFPDGYYTAAEYKGAPIPLYICSTRYPEDVVEVVQQARFPISVEQTIPGLWVALVHPMTPSTPNKHRAKKH